MNIKFYIIFIPEQYILYILFLFYFIFAKGKGSQRVWMKFYNQLQEVAYV